MATPAYTHCAVVTFEIDFSSATSTGLANMSATIDASSDSILWAMGPGGNCDNSASPFFISTSQVYNANHAPSSSIPIAQLSFSNQAGGDKKMGISYIPQAQNGDATAFFINSYIWGTSAAASAGDVKMNATIDSGVTLYINGTEWTDDNEHPVPVTWKKF